MSPTGEDGVAEVLTFASSGPLIAGTGREPEGVVVIRDFGLALMWALQQPPDSPSTVDWTDLREYHVASINAREYALSKELRAGFEQRSSAIADSLERTVYPRLRALGFERATNEVAVDLWKVATSRLLPGPQSEFWEAVFALYLAGGWPCGWDGPSWDEGRLAVFCPPKSPAA